MALPKLTSVPHSIRLALSAALAMLALLLAAASTASAADPSATAPGQPRAGSVRFSGAGVRIERPCTQPLCLFLLDKGRFRTIPHPFANVYVFVRPSITAVR